MRPWGLDLNNLTYLEEEEHRPIYERSDTRKGDVLLVKDGVNAGDTAINTIEGEISLLSSVCFLRPKKILRSKFLRYYLQSPQCQAELLGNLSGSAIRRIILRKIRELPIIVAPLEEQDAIITELDIQLSRLDGSITTLQGIQAKLKQARVSILKAAVEGRLVETEAELARRTGAYFEDAQELLERAWVESMDQRPSRGKRPKSAGDCKKDLDLDLPEPPDGWAWCRIDAVGAVQLGRQRTPKDHSGPNMRPYLRVANVFEDRIDLSDVKEMNFTPEELEIYRLQQGDILLNEGQSPHLVGRPAMWRNEIENACFQNTLVRFNCYEAVLPRFALIVVRAQLHARRYMKIAKLTTNIAHLGAQRFAAVEFPLAPLEEQKRIIEEVERRFSVLDQVEATVTASLARCGKLRQAILKRAFGGWHKLD